MKALVFSESSTLAAQVISGLKSVLDFSVAVPKDQADSVSEYGAKEVISLDGNPQMDAFGKKISELMNSYDFLFVPSTVLGREVAGYVSAALGQISVPEISKFEIVDSKCKTSSLSLGGKSIIDIISDAKVLTVAPGFADPVKVSEKSKISVMTLPDSSVSVISEEEKNGTGVNIESAKVIVSIGRGIGKKESISIVDPLLKAVHGELAGSRPVCLDYQWLSEDRQVGLSGKKVNPNVYIAVGISGQIQHIAGMRGSKIVVAINRDKSAPIFEECDYGIVGDLFQVIPKLVAAING